MPVLINKKLDAAEEVVRSKDSTIKSISEITDKNLVTAMYEDLVDAQFNEFVAKEGSPFGKTLELKHAGTANKRKTFDSVAIRLA